VPRSSHPTPPASKTHVFYPFFFTVFILFARNFGRTRRISSTMQRTTKKTMDESDAKSSASFSASAASAALGGLMGSVSEKWNSSGASDAVAKINANLPQGTKDLLGSASAKIQFRREHFRGVGIFFGLGEDKPFYLEKNPALLMPRLKHNVSFFYLNYAVLTCILFLLTVLVSPSALIGMALLAFSWMSVIKSTETGEMKIKGKFMIGWLGGLVGGWRVGTNKQLAIREGESNVRTRVRQVVLFPVTNCIWSVFGETPLLELFHSARQYIVICRGRYGYPEVVLVVRSSGAESRKGRKLNGRTDPDGRTGPVGPPVNPLYFATSEVDRPLASADVPVAWHIRRSWPARRGDTCFSWADSGRFAKCVLVSWYWSADGTGTLPWYFDSHHPHHLFHSNNSPSSAGFSVSQKQAYVGMTGISVLVLFYLLSHIFWWTMFTSGFLVGSHAALRDASMHKDEEDKVAMSGDLSLEEEQAAFLGDEV
jgi:hypothetical protein